MVLRPAGHVPSPRSSLHDPRLKISHSYEECWTVGMTHRHPVKRMRRKGDMEVSEASYFDQNCPQSL